MSVFQKFEVRLIKNFENLNFFYKGEKVLELPETCKSTKILFWLVIVEKNLEIFLWPPLLQSNPYLLITRGMGHGTEY
jgi:hypothetical protein